MTCPCRTDSNELVALQRTTSQSLTVKAVCFQSHDSSSTTAPSATISAFSNLEIKSSNDRVLQDVRKADSMPAALASWLQVSDKGAQRSLKWTQSGTRLISQRMKRQKHIRKRREQNAEESKAQRSQHLFDATPGNLKLFDLSDSNIELFVVCL